MVICRFLQRLLKKNLQSFNGNFKPGPCSWLFPLICALQSMILHRFNLEKGGFLPALAVIPSVRGIFDLGIKIPPLKSAFGMTGSVFPDGLYLSRITKNDVNLRVLTLSRYMQPGVVITASGLFTSIIRKKSN